MDASPYKSKNYVYVVVAGYVLSIIVSAVFNVPVIAAIGFLVVVIVSAIELRNMYRSSQSYPGLMGKMESWYGRKNITVFFSFLAVLLLLMAISSVYKYL